MRAMGIRWDHSVEAIIKSLTISREVAGSVNGEGGHFRAMGRETPVAVFVCAAIWQNL
jgi:hypothetical protein